MVVQYALDTVYTLAGLQNMNGIWWGWHSWDTAPHFRLLFNTAFQVPNLYCVVVAPLFIHRKIHSILYALLCVLRNQDKNRNHNCEFTSVIPSVHMLYLSYHTLQRLSISLDIGRPYQWLQGELCCGSHRSKGPHSSVGEGASVRRCYSQSVSDLNSYEGITILQIFGNYSYLLFNET